MDEAVKETREMGKIPDKVLEGLSNSIPHLGQITVNAVVYKQTPKGDFDPKAVWHDSFAINLLSESVEGCIEEIKKKLEEIKEKKNEPTNSN